MLSIKWPVWQLSRAHGDTVTRSDEAPSSVVTVALSTVRLAVVWHIIIMARRVKACLVVCWKAGVETDVLIEGNGTGRRPSWGACR